jgi:transposase InsO family protein
VAEAREACRRELDRQGWEVGWEKVYAGLPPREDVPREASNPLRDGPEPLRKAGSRRGKRGSVSPLAALPPRKYSQALVRECVQDLKAMGRSVDRLLLEVARSSVRVLLRGALWTLDETHLGRLLDGMEVSGLLIRDVASTRTLLASVGPAASGADLVAALEHLLKTRGELPLVLGEDNGPPMKDERVAAWCAEHQVVILRSRPHVSTDNPAVEHGHREIKEVGGLGKGVLLWSDEEAAERLERAVACVDGRRLRTTRGFQTAEALDRTMPRWYPAVDRRTFYEAACRAIREAVQECQDAGERRLAERRAIFETMERFGLIQWTRGGCSLALAERQY